MSEAVLIYVGSVLGIVHTVALPAWQLEQLFQFGSMEKANLDYQADADKSLALRSKEDEK